MTNSIKAIILIGGPNKGQRFRPLSFNSPKYMFPVGGQTIIGHLIESCVKLENLTDILLLGFYQPDETLSDTNLQRLVNKCATKNKNIRIRYLQEFTRVGTAGGMYHFRDQIRHGNPSEFIVLNGDVCGDFDLELLLEHHRNLLKTAPESNKPKITVMTTEASRDDSLNYGCLVVNQDNHQIEHYVEKPSTFISDLINCGIYACSLQFLDLLEETMRQKREELLANSTSSDLSPTFSSSRGDSIIGQLNTHPDYLSLELRILQNRLTQPSCYSYKTQGKWWCQVKTASSAIYANRQYLRQYGRESPYWLQDNDTNISQREFKVLGDVYIHPTASIDKSSVIGPNVSIMENCVIGPGVRIKDSIVLKEAAINSHSLIMNSIVGWNCVIGTWVRVEGSSSNPDPNNRFAKVANPPLFNVDGKLNPSISVLGCNVRVADGTVILNSIILPHKELGRCYKNEIVL